MRLCQQPCLQVEMVDGRSILYSFDDLDERQRFASKVIKSDSEIRKARYFSRPAPQMVQL